MSLHSTVRGARGNCDNFPCELPRLMELQSKLDNANLLVMLARLPETIQIGKQMIEEVKAEVWEIVNDADNYASRTDYEYRLRQS